MLRFSASASVRYYLSGLARQTATVLAVGILLNYIIVLVVVHQTSLILTVFAIAGLLLALTVDRRLLFANIHLRRSDWALYRLRAVDGAATLRPHPIAAPV